MVKNDQMIFTLSDSISWQVERSKGFVYILDEKEKRYYLLDGVAKDIWLLAVKGIPIDEIPQRMFGLYDIDFDIMENDIYTFVESLVVSGLLVHN